MILDLDTEVVIRLPCLCSTAGAATLKPPFKCDSHGMGILQRHGEVRSHVPGAMGVLAARRSSGHRFIIKST